MKYNYEVIDIPDCETVASDWKFLESDWMCIVDYINGYFYEYNIKTGETRQSPSY